MPEHQYNTFWPRFWAGFLDWLIFLPLPFMDAWFFNQNYSNVAFFIYYAVISTLGFSIYSVLMHGTYGQTIGKIIMGIQVQSLNHERLGYKKAFIRDLVIILVCIYNILVYAGSLWFDVEINKSSYDFALFIIMGWFLLEIITMLTNEKRRAVHDFIAGSVVKRID